MKDVSKREEEESCGLIPPPAHVDVPIKKNITNVALLFAAAVLYSSAVGGAVEILGSFVLKEPLSWNAKQVTCCPLCLWIVVYCWNVYSLKWLDYV